ncbi:MAG: O-antigen ligase family protein [Candidatus Omnitrophica bacterium]|nr:O-antigen ligase family protein [Candidatus Omnitrophota bacterium]
MTDRIYKNILQTGVAAIMVFAPLAKGAMRSWSIAVVEVSVMLLVFMWLWRVNNHSDCRLKRTGLDIPILLFGILAIVSCMFSIYKFVSIKEFILMLTFAGVFYLVADNFNRKMMFHLGVLVVVIGVVTSTFGLIQYFSGLGHSWWRPDNFLASTYVNHNHFAGYLELAIPLGIGMLFASRGTFKGQGASGKGYGSKILLIVALIVMFTAFLFSQSRGAWASLAGAFLVTNIIFIRKKILQKWTVAAFLLLLVLMGALIAAGYDDVSERLGTLTDAQNEASLKTRAKIWQGGIEMVKENPVTGVGVGAFGLGFREQRPPGLSVRANFAHNDYLHMMAETGVLALPIMVWMIVLVLRSGFRSMRMIPPSPHAANACAVMDLSPVGGVALGATVGILSLSFHALVDFNFHITANMLTAAVLIGIIIGYENPAK